MVYNSCIVGYMMCKLYMHLGICNPPFGPGGKALIHCITCIGFIIIFDLSHFNISLLSHRVVFQHLHYFHYVLTADSEVVKQQFTHSLKNTPNQDKKIKKRQNIFSIHNALIDQIGSFQFTLRYIDPSFKKCKNFFKLCINLNDYCNYGMHSK